MIHIFQTDDGHVPANEYLPASAITPRAGMALKIESGKLTPATGADAPLYLSMTERTAACADGELIPVVRIHENMIFRTTTPESFTATAGQTVQLSADGCGLSSTADGAAEVIYSDEIETRFRLHNAGAVGTAVDVDDFNTVE